MVSADLKASWGKTIRHLHAARTYLSEDLFFEEAREYEGQMNDYLSHNELDLALDAAEMLGTICNGSSQFWRELQSAAENMGLIEEADRYALLANV